MTCNDLAPSNQTYEHVEGIRSLDALLGLVQHVLGTSAPPAVAAAAAGTALTLVAIMEHGGDPLPGLPIKSRSLTLTAQAELSGARDAIRFARGGSGPFWWTPLEQEIERRKEARSQPRPAAS